MTFRTFLQVIDEKIKNEKNKNKKLILKGFKAGTWAMHNEAALDLILKYLDDAIDKILEDR